MTQKKIQMVFFDAAGTLFDVRGSVGEIYARCASQYDKHVAPAELQREFARQFPRQPPMAFARTLGRAKRLQLEQDWWRTLVRDVFTPFGEFPHFDNYFLEVYEFFRRAEAWRVFADVEPTLTALKARGLRLGVISNFDTRLYEVLDELQLSAYFDSIHISTEVGAAKPDAAIFEVALADNALSPSQALHIGDSLMADAQGAQAAGLSALWLNRQGEALQINKIQAASALCPEIITNVLGA